MLQALYLQQANCTLTIIVGGRGTGNNTYDDVYQFDVTSQTWIQVGTLQQARYLHALSVVNQQEINSYCN